MWNDIDLKELINRTRAGKFAVLLVASRPPDPPVLSTPSMQERAHFLQDQMQPSMEMPRMARWGRACGWGEGALGC